METSQNFLENYHKANQVLLQFFRQPVETKRIISGWKATDVQREEMQNTVQQPNFQNQVHLTT